MTEPPSPPPTVRIFGDGQSLLGALIKELEKRPAHPLDDHLVIVPTSTAAQWLRLRLAEQHGKLEGKMDGISMGIEVATMTKLRETILPGAQRRWGAEALTWRILRAIEASDDLRKSAPFQRLSTWLGYDDAQELGPGSGRRYSWAARTAKLYADYLEERPDLLREWTDNDNKGETNDTHGWQQLLWKTLAGQEGAPDPANRIAQRESIAKPAWLNSVHLAWFSDLTPLQHELLTLMAKQGIETTLWLTDNNPSLVPLGWNEQRTTLVETLSPASKTVRPDTPRASDSPPGEDGPTRPAFSFHDCANILDESRLAARLTTQALSYEGRRPEDVVIVTPSLSAMSGPLLSAFEPEWRSQAKQGGTPPLWLVTGQSAQSPASQLVEGLLRLAKDGLTRSGVLDILALPGIAKHFDLEGSVPTVKALVDEAGIHRGLNAEDEQALSEEIGTWMHGLRRLALGLAYSGIDDDTFMWDETPPVLGMPGTLTQPLEKLLDFVTQLSQLVAGLKTSPASGAEWATRLTDALKAFPTQPDEDVQAMKWLLRELETEDVKGISLSLDEVLQWYESRRPDRQREHDRPVPGAVLVCEVDDLPMAPFAHVIVLGMDDTTFPPTSTPHPETLLPADALLRQTHRAAQRLLTMIEHAGSVDVIYQGRDASTGMTLDTPGAVQTLQDAVCQGYGEVAKTTVHPIGLDEPTSTAHPLQQPGETPATTEATTDHPDTNEDQVQTITISTLTNWFTKPLTQWWKTHSGADFTQAEGAVTPDLPRLARDFTHLEKWSYRNTLMNRMLLLDGEDPKNQLDDWKNAVLRTGQFPVHQDGQTLAKKLIEEATGIVTTLKEATKRVNSSAPTAIDTPCEVIIKRTGRPDVRIVGDPSGQRSGNWLIAASASSNDLSKMVEPWLRLLLMRASGEKTFDGMSHALTVFNGSGSMSLIGVDAGVRALRAAGSDVNGTQPGNDKMTAEEATRLLSYALDLYDRLQESPLYLNAKQAHTISWTRLKKDKEKGIPDLKKVDAEWPSLYDTSYDEHIKWLFGWHRPDWEANLPRTLGDMGAHDAETMFRFWIPLCLAQHKAIARNAKNTPGVRHNSDVIHQETLEALFNGGASA